VGHDPTHLEALLFLGSLLMESARHSEAEQIFAQALRLSPASIAAASGLAAALQSLSRRAEAISVLDSLVLLRPDHAMSWYNRGNLLLESGRHADAAQSYGRAIALNSRLIEAWHNRAMTRVALGDGPGAEADFTRVLDLNPLHVSALTERGFLLNRLERHADALADFDRVLSLGRDHVAAWLGRGIALARLNQEDEALLSFSEALRLDSTNPLTLYNRAALLSSAKRFEEASRDLEELLDRTPDFPLARGLFVDAKLHLCDWRGLAEQVTEIAGALHRGQRVIHPFVHLTISGSPEDQLTCAQIQAAEAYPAASPLYRGEKYQHEKIRVAYLSGDLFEHAVPLLVTGVLEHHDRNRFDTYGISLGAKDNSEMRKRLENAFTQFIDVSNSTNSEIANLLRKLEIDIAVDLSGYTGRGRAGVLAHRAAPIQVNYLGYPGTLGAQYIDYLIADRTVIPPEHRRFYPEHIVWLPDTYQANDSARRVSNERPTRNEALLPDAEFVFCCFNGNHKILPETFARWMRILRLTGNSVLWLLENNPRASANLRTAADSQGVSPARLVFAQQEPPDRHLARLPLADLVLDTLPYGAHTTASDALRMGVPVLTLLGGSFAGRVAASLLSAIGCPELITSSASEYESFACELTRNPALLEGIKNRIAHNGKTAPLFDTPRMTRNLEAAYTEMWQRHQRGESPTHFAV
jgi:predicted O-linked N-acetylglucosamine transferase (SPINDLY family)